MEYKIALIPGDGIGPEIVAEARRKASEMLRLLDEQTAKQAHETDSVDSYPQK